MTTINVHIHSSDGIVCFYNNLRRLANERGILLRTIEVDVVAITDDASPGTRQISLQPKIESDAGDDEIQDLITQALQESYVADMLTHSVLVKLGSPGAVG